MKTTIKKLALGLLMASTVLGPAPLVAGQTGNLEKPSDIIKKDFISHRNHESIWEEIKHTWKFWDNLSEAMSVYDTENENQQVLSALYSYRYSADDIIKNKKEAEKNIDVNIERIISSAAESSNFALFKQLYYHMCYPKEKYLPAFKLIITSSGNDNKTAWITSLEKYYQTKKIDPKDKNYYDLMLFLDKAVSVNTLDDAIPLIKPALFYTREGLLVALLKIVNPEAKPLKKMNQLDEEQSKCIKLLPDPDEQGYKPNLDPSLYAEMDKINKHQKQELLVVKQNLKQYATAQAKLSSLSNSKNSIIENADIVHAIAQYY